MKYICLVLILFTGLITGFVLSRLYMEKKGYEAYNTYSIFDMVKFLITPPHKILPICKQYYKKLWISYDKGETWKEIIIIGEPK